MCLCRTLLSFRSMRTPDLARRRNQWTRVDHRTALLRVGSAVGSRLWAMGSRPWALGLSVALSLGACTTGPSTVSESYGGSLYPGRSYSVTVLVAKVGTVKLTLTSLALPTQVIGLGLGTPGDGLSCNLTVTTKASGTGAAQLAAAVNPGRYCVEVYDLGGLTDSLSFTLVIQHP